MATPSHYIAAQVGSRESTGYLRLAPVPDGVACDYPLAFTHLDLGAIREIQAIGTARPYGLALKGASKGKVTFSDAMGRKVTLAKRGRVWTFSRACAKGIVTGRVADSASLTEAVPAILTEWQARKAFLARSGR